ncbi:MULTISPECIES: glycine cleavage system protein GcvH [unclassified Prochlorococcus]|uniref:glycine cleavage system protein GcvH n=1 Tax=unclassified Prochlorococcus TaxID=2627481 RepID=UPI0005337D74|nr:MULTISPECIES: glycine cleavage system protein GcvH [unclassified Prochlorococcus]KGG14554.1 Glycine cleavage system H protein [Prochlorococcus sp. MIT 0602]KGG16021.1 Glycine cleavage system H protein [Prochlorococcus sp. MIT 0603]
MIFNFPDDFLFADTHEYAHIENDLVRIGISAFAVDQLGDIVFVDLPDQGSTLEQGSSFGTVESVKAVEDMNAPISGEVLEINSSVLESPEALQNDPHGEGWLLLVRPTDIKQLDQLLSSDLYSKKVAST